MSKTDALAQLEKFFYQGLEHKGVQLPAAINFAHYTHGISFQKSATAKQPALPFMISGLGYLASKLRKNLLPLFL
jgi:hypothetical protein